MSILQIRETVQATTSGAACEIVQYLGQGNQGEVYKVKVENRELALKWYHPHYLAQDPMQQQRLINAMEKGAPSDRFLWPLDLVTSNNHSGFGYLMPYREDRFESLVKLMKRKIRPSFRTLFTAGFEMAHHYLLLHAKGLCYCDISFGNVAFDDQTGEIRIADNDNVDKNRNNSSGVLGTPRFMAPEIVRGEARPSRDTDRFSLAVLLFYLLMIHHPLEGQQVHAIHVLDAAALRKVFGTHPLFIWDPQNPANRPVPGAHQNAIDFWNIYPQALKALFTQAFTDGMNNPAQRVEESVWRKQLIQFRDSIIPCATCNAENFYESRSAGTVRQCWHCQQLLTIPPRLRLDNGTIIILNNDTKLYLHHLTNKNSENFNFSRLVAEMNINPQNPVLKGLKNLTNSPWTAIDANGRVQPVDPGRSVALANGLKIHFNTREGEVRL